MSSQLQAAQSRGVLCGCSLVVVIQSQNLFSCCDTKSKSLFFAVPVLQVEGSNFVYRKGQAFEGSVH